MAADGEGGAGPTALVSKEAPGGGQLVDSSTVGRPVGDTSSSAVFVSDLPKNFHGGDEALHFALGELFGQYGKIKKIELYMEEGILETQNFKGEALVVFHKTKHTGSHDKGDPVYESCTDMDGRWRLLGKRGWRMRCEPAEWQKEGYDVKAKPKVHPCVEISNLWEYDPSKPMAWFAEMQEVIRKHAAEHVASPFVKVEPSEGTATIWTKGAQDAMKFAGMMHKSFFFGRKIAASLCRKEKPIFEEMAKAPTGELTMQLPTEVWDGSGPLPGAGAAQGPAIVGPAPFDPAAAAAEAEAAAAATAEEAPAVAGPAALLEKGSRARLKGLVSKPENNGRLVQVNTFLFDLGKYQVVMEDGRSVKVKPENLEPLRDEDEVVGPAPKRRKGGPTLAEKVAAAADKAFAEAAEAEAEAAMEAEKVANAMAAGDVRAAPAPAHDPKRDGFLPTVCVDPSLLPKREEPVPEETAEQKRDRSKSRERRQKERMEAVKARLEADKSSRPKWVMPSPEELAAQQAAASAGGDAAAGGATLKEPEQSREELMKLSVGKLKELLKEFGKTARGCLEKRDFVDRLKPAPKA
mmetsp:Transcript_40689/g.103439  ORF Transcript_40689/g.103439 Transcript_40689/m.103439 type:complete len:578 (+) Transcript_40689:143-1876(+)